MEYFCVHGPGQVVGLPVEHGDEYTFFIVDCYALSEHPSNNHMRYDSSFFSRPKGCDKSGLAARLALFEALGPCRFAGWAKGGEVYEDPWGLGFRYVYERGEPMGKAIKAPVIQCMATEVGQVGNVFETIWYNLGGADDYDDDMLPPLLGVPGISMNQEKVLLPKGGEIRVATASSAAKDGGRETFVIFDETHLYTTKELHRMYRTVTRNLRKRKKVDGTWYIETTTMFAPDEDSMAKKTYEQAELLKEGRLKVGRWRLLYDHRWGECRNLQDEAELRNALVEAYGDAMAWMELDSLVDDFYDLRNEAADSRRYFLNAKTSSSDAWIKEHEWVACKRPASRPLQPRDFIALGYDGSRRDDASALVAVRIPDMHMELLDCWEKPEDAGDDWQVDREAVDAAVNRAMKTYEVAGFYADPAGWQDYVDRWTNEFKDRVQVFASAKAPFEWWTNRDRPMVAALARFKDAILDQVIGFTPAEDRAPGSDEAKRTLTLTRHILNAKVAIRGRAGEIIEKEHHKSKKKIDAAMAATLALECAFDALAQGVKPRQAESYLPKRIR